MTDPRIPDYLQVKHLTLCRDDLIEYILKHVKEEWEGRVYDGKSYLSIGIDKETPKEEKDVAT